MKTPVVEIPLVSAKVTDRNRNQTEQLCRYYGYEYIANEKPGPPIAKFEGVNEGGPFVLVVALIEGSFTHDQVYEIMEKEGVVFGQNIWRFRTCAGWALPEGCACGVFSHEEADPRDLTIAMDALIALEVKKKRDAAKP